MVRVELAPEIGDDFDRILDHLRRYEVTQAMARSGEIIDVRDVLETNPRIGRPTDKDTHGLVISHGTHGYVALYRYVAAVDTVFVLAVRTQREAGYTRV